MNIKNTPTQKYTLIKGDIFYHAKNRADAPINSSHVIIPHVCNNVNAFGAGFAADVADRFPEVKENFHLLGKNAKLGHTQFIETYIDKTNKNKLILANMIAQNRLVSKNNPRPLNYGSLAICMYNIRNYAYNLAKNSETNRVEIHAPKFGCGLAGGNWHFIMELINDIWSDLDVFIYLK